VSDEGGRKVFRRTGAAIFFVVMAIAVLGIALAVTIQSDGREAIVPWAVTVPLAALSVIGGVLPKLVTTPTGVEVHNMFTRFVIPYPAITEAVEGRRGVAVRTFAGRTIPVVAFGRSSFADFLTGNAAARKAINEINARSTTGAHHPGEPPPPIERQLKVPVIVGLGLVLALAAVALLTSGTR
jgi:hypothetical protein